MNTDYIVIGSIGYAQLGQDDYYQREQKANEIYNEKYSISQ